MDSPMLEVMDTTLRDGEQMKDVSYSAEEKLTIARMLLDEVGVNRVELTSALVSAGERESAANVLKWAEASGHGDNIEILGFTDRGRSVDWIAGIGGRVMNLLAKGSLTHVTKQLRKTPEQHAHDILETVLHGNKAGVICNIYLEDWSNGMIDSSDYVFFLLDALADSHIRRYMLPDTLGMLSPARVAEFVSRTLQRYPGLHFDFHGHDDYGLATANTLAAVKAGVHGIHCTVNGMGERAGNTSLDEAVVGVHDFLDRRTSVNEQRLIKVSETVDIFSGRRVAFNKPISGPNVFTQTAGIHADGDKKGNLYAGRLLPERFNRRRQYALGKLSGKANLDYNLKELGIDLTDEQRRVVLGRIVELGDRKETITKEDLPYIISDVLERPSDKRFLLRSCIVVSSFGGKSVATAKLAYREADASEYAEYEECALGDGGYDAFMNAVTRIVATLGLEIPTLIDYKVAIPQGGRSDALVQCAITWRTDSTFVTKGVNSDQVLAAADATEKMLNIFVVSPQRQVPAGDVSPQAV